MRVVLTREAGHNDLLREYVPVGAQILEVPLSRTRYRTLAEVTREIESSRDFGAFETLVVTSPRSDEYLETVRPALSPDAEIYSVGRSTTRALVRHDFTLTGESSGSAADLAPFVTRGPVLLLGAKIIRRELPDALDKRGLRIFHLACYETVPVDLDDSGREVLASADVVFVGAPSAWRLCQEFVRESAWVVVPGSTTGDEVRLTHDRVIEGWDPSLRDVLDSLES